MTELKHAASDIFKAEITRVAVDDYVDALTAQLQDLGFVIAQKKTDWKKHYMDAGIAGLLIPYASTDHACISLVSRLEVFAANEKKQILKGNTLSVVFAQAGIKAGKGDEELLHHYFPGNEDGMFTPHYLGDDPNVQTYDWSEAGNAALMHTISHWILNYGDRRLVDKLIPAEERKARLPVPRLLPSSGG